MDLFLRSIHCKKDGKDHRYLSIVEDHRIAPDNTVQRTVLYLGGEISDHQQAASCKTLSVFDEQQQKYANLSLFPDDREIPDDAIDSLQFQPTERPPRRQQNGSGLQHNDRPCGLGEKFWIPRHSHTNHRQTLNNECGHCAKVLERKITVHRSSHGREIRDTIAGGSKVLLFARHKNEEREAFGIRKEGT